jgi:two-component system, NtrC family, nitrogen regulation sensor histidine kinase NtrY
MTLPDAKGSVISPLLPAALLYLAALLVAVWAGGGGPLFLVGSSVAGLAFVLLMRRDPGPRRLPGLSVFVLAAVALGFGAEGHLARISATWDARDQAREAEVTERLSGELDALLLAGEEAAARLAALHDPEVGRLRAPIPLELVADGVDAVAVFGPGGDLIAWEGNHQGPVPREARLGLSPYIYHESALFGYLYVTRPLVDGTGTAVSASLLRSDLPATLEGARTDFVSRFAASTSARIDVGREDRVEGEAAWGLTWEREILFSVSVLSGSEAELRHRVSVRWRWAVTVLLLLLWVGTARATRDVRGGRTLAAVSLAALALALPLGLLAGEGRLFSPADLLLPGPLSLTLGDVLLLGAAGVLLLGFVAPSRFPSIPRVPAAGAAIGGVLAGWGLLWLFGRSASRDLLIGPEFLWVLFQGAAFLLVSLAWAVAVQAGRRKGGPTRPGWILGAAAAALAAGGIGAALVRTGGAWPTLLPLGWIVPLLILVGAFGADQGWRDAMLRWVGVGVLSSTLVLPWAWGTRVEARVADAEDRIERLGTRSDPYLEFLLLRTGEEARDLSLAGRNPVEVLYGAWAGSGLAREGVPVWLTWWSPEGFAQEELRIGVSTPRPPIPADLRMAALIEGEIRLIREDLADTHYLVAAPLSRGATLTAVVPPRRGFSGDSPLGPLFSPARSDPDPVTLVPLLPGEIEVPVGGVRWTLTDDAWLGEVPLTFPDQVYLVQYAVTLPRPTLVLTRGTLLLLASVATLLLLWSGGRRLAFPGPVPLPRVAAALTSFRGRVTLALFAFFLIPTFLFGMLSYRTLAGASLRTAETLAARAAEGAASGFADTGGAMDLLAARVGSDLLLYEGGQLVGSSQRELVELGLYQGWIPPAVHQALTDGSGMLTTSTASLGGWEYVVAYRRMPGGQVLAAPAALQAGATAVRQREVADLLAFSLVLGGGLSVLLALLVGRALSRPIQTLQIASERVGSGNMGVHLPTDRTDEFGAVFGAFNRMVDRLARTRRALVRSSRRTRAIVEEVATGIVAVDAQGRITLANPRAEALLGVPLARNQRVPAPAGAEADGDADLAGWVEEYLRDGVAEAGTEFTLGGRRIRLRARRITGSRAPAGAVLAIEDVTDELRTERILAWGEMAQQVAHEVKNPLTPIKLGIQHIRRAWTDRRPDYDEILDRNVAAILTEIDRLAAISSSFSRFAAPAAGDGGPLEPVELGGVIDEVMALYAAGEGPVRFKAALQPGLRVVQARPDELKEVLVNLLENARAALPEGGTVRVEAEASGDGLLVRVRDDGTGIPSELMPRIFEPHFSTRSTGAGLGLAIVRRLVESWGGWVEADSREGEGTTVAIHLRAAADPPVDADREPMAGQRTGTETGGALKGESR